MNKFIFIFTISIFACATKTKNHNTHNFSLKIKPEFNSYDNIDSIAIYKSYVYLELAKNLEFNKIKPEIFSINKSKIQDNDSNLIKLGYFLNKYKDSLSYTLHVDQTGLNKSLKCVYVTIDDTNYINSYHGMISFYYTVISNNEVLFHRYGLITVPKYKNNLNIVKNDLNQRLIEYINSHNLITHDTI